MNLTYKEICEVNAIQLEIFKEFTRVCEVLQLKYYMIHGSLLGAVRYGGFFPFDDDIDVAMPRKDYERLIHEGAGLFDSSYFVQTCETEPEFPLAFAKIRNTNTAFIQPSMRNFQINQGIYIDVFPIDYYPTGRIVQAWLTAKGLLYQIRISARISYDSKQQIWKKVLRMVSKIVYPSWEKAVRKRAMLYSSVLQGDTVIIVGGKQIERGIPSAWFSSGQAMEFEDMSVICPSKYQEYLACIYGDYESYNPAKEYMNADQTVCVSADNVSTVISYQQMR